MNISDPVPTLTVALEDCLLEVKESHERPGKFVYQKIQFLFVCKKDPVSSWQNIGSGSDLFNSDSATWLF